MQNISLIGTVVLEKKSFERFLSYMSMAAILNFARYFFLTKFCTINMSMLNMKFHENWLGSFIGNVI